MAVSLGMMLNWECGSRPLLLTLKTGALSRSWTHSIGKDRKGATLCPSFRCPKIAFYCASSMGWCELPLHHKMYYSKGLGRMSGRGHCTGSGSSFLTGSLPGASGGGSPLTTVRASAHQEEVGIWVTSSVSHHSCHSESDPANARKRQDDAPSAPSARRALHIETSHY